MKAMKLSSDPNEKKQLKSQCSDIMNTAGRIKNDTDWRSAVDSQQARVQTQKVNISQWAAEVVSAQPTPVDFGNNVSQSSLSRHGLSSMTAPLGNVSIPSGKRSLSTISIPGQNGRSFVSSGTCEELRMGPFVLLIDLSDDQSPSTFDLASLAHTDTRHEDRSQTTPNSVVGTHAPSSTALHTSPPLKLSSPDQHSKVTQAAAAEASPSIAPYSHIHRLAEPVSSRKRSKREDIILLKASMVNGFKCPPWDKTPSPDEFQAQQDTELFV
jgi:calpain-7